MDMNNNYQNNFNQNPVQSTQNYQQPNYSGTPINQGNKPITGWNWGAMMYGWIWGIANGCYLPLLGLIPFINWFWWIVCGIKGNEWAMNGGKWKTVEEFNAVQRSWNTAGKIAFWYFVIVFGIGIAIWLFTFVFGIGMAGLAGILESMSY